MSQFLRCDVVGWCISRKHKWSMNVCVWVEWRFIRNTSLAPDMHVFELIFHEESHAFVLQSWWMCTFPLGVCLWLTLQKSQQNPALYTEQHKPTSSSRLHNRRLWFLWICAPVSLFSSNKLFSQTAGRVWFFLLNILSCSASLFSVVLPNWCVVSLISVLCNFSHALSFNHWYEYWFGPPERWNVVCVKPVNNRL